MPTLFLLIVILLYVFGPKKESIKWLIFTLSFAALYDIAQLIANVILPTMESYGLSNSSVHTALIKMLPSIIFLHETFTPYGFLLFSIVHAEMTSRRNKNMWAVMLTSPIIIMITVAAVNLNFQLDFKALLIWAAPYYLTTCFLLIFAYLKEQNPKKKKVRLAAACVVVPSTLVNLVSDNIAKAIGYRMDEVWYLYVIGAIAFVMFIIYAIRFGVFGVKIKFEKQLLDQKITGVATGTSMLNHALKNRITNIDMLAGRMKEAPQLLQHKRLNGDIELILEETKQMMQMVKRIQKQIEDVEIVESAANLADIITQALQSNRLLLESKGVSVVTDYSVNFNVLCDKVHLQEVFNNLLRNAIDEMETATGLLTISIYEDKKYIVIDFTDNGKGISKETVDQIFDPFFSTKHREDNFGLGLSYCYIVMGKHGGKIDVANNQDSGATFTVQLPKRRIV